MLILIVQQSKLQVQPQEEQTNPVGEKGVPAEQSRYNMAVNTGGTTVKERFGVSEGYERIRV